MIINKCKRTFFDYHKPIGREVKGILLGLIGIGFVSATLLVGQTKPYFFARHKREGLYRDEGGYIPLVAIDLRFIDFRRRIGKITFDGCVLFKGYRIACCDTCCIGSVVFYCIESTI